MVKSGGFSSESAHYRSMRIRGADVFYREAGPKDAPTLLLLHGFPTSSNMFRNLIPRLSPSFRLIAPDYPGFGLSGMPGRKDFAYTFDHQPGVHAVAVRERSERQEPA